MGSLLYLVAVVLFVVAAVLAWPAHVPVLFAFGLACIAAAALVGLGPWIRPPR